MFLSQVKIVWMFLCPLFFSPIRSSRSGQLALCCVVSCCVVTCCVVFAFFFSFHLWVNNLFVRCWFVGSFVCLVWDAHSPLTWLRNISNISSLAYFATTCAFKYLIHFAFTCLFQWGSISVLHGAKLDCYLWMFFLVLFMHWNGHARPTRHCTIRLVLGCMSTIHIHPNHTWHLYKP